MTNRYYSPDQVIGFIAGIRLAEACVLRDNGCILCNLKELATSGDDPYPPDVDEAVPADSKLWCIDHNGQLGEIIFEWLKNRGYIEPMFSTFPMIFYKITDSGQDFVANLPLPVLTVVRDSIKGE